MFGIQRLLVVFVDTMFSCRVHMQAAVTAYDWKLVLMQSPLKTCLKVIAPQVFSIYTFVDASHWHTLSWRPLPGDTPTTRAVATVESFATPTPHPAPPQPPSTALAVQHIALRTCRGLSTPLDCAYKKQPPVVSELVCRSLFVIVVPRALVQLLCTHDDCRRRPVKLLGSSVDPTHRPPRPARPASSGASCMVRDDSRV